MKRVFPKSSIILAFADLFSLLINLLIFRTLMFYWDKESFADWEWLSIWLGICMLIPRNGLETVALRAAVIHPSHLREWSAVVLVVRAILGSIASLIFFGTALSIKPLGLSLILPLALTLVISSLSPDVSARAQFRFVKSSLIIMSRNILFMIFLMTYSLKTYSQSMAGWALLSAEIGLFLLWFCDSWINNSIPGGRWTTLFRRAWKPILKRTIEQTITRWIRVFSWSCDALILGMIAPSLWQEVAPARRFLMTGVIPIAGWLGSLGPILSRHTSSEHRQFLNKGALMALTVSFVSAFVAFQFGPDMIQVLFGMKNEMDFDSEILSLNALRFAPIVVVMMSGACLTAIKADKIVFVPGLIHLSGLFLGCIPAIISQSSIVSFRMMVAIEYVSAIVGLLIVLKTSCDVKTTVVVRNHYKKARLRVDSGASTILSPIKDDLTHESNMNQVSEVSV